MSRRVPITTLRATRQPLVAIASPVIYESIIRQDYPGIPPSHWHPVVARIKEGLQEAWVHVPGDLRAPRRAQALVAGATDAVAEAG